MPFFFRNAVENAKIVHKEKMLWSKQMDARKFKWHWFLYEVGVLLSCHEIEHCSCCRHLLKWCLEILCNRWDEIRFINFFDAMKVIKQNRSFFGNDVLNRYWEQNEEKVKSIISFYKNTDEPFQAIYENKELFEIFNF